MRPYLRSTLLVGYALSCLNALGADCAALKDPGDGTPKEYLVHECEGNQALAAHHAKAAAEHFRKALGVNLFEAPNYSLRLELGIALCELGQATEGKKEIGEFLRLSALDLRGRLDEDSGSSLSAQAKRRLTGRRKKANAALKGCGKR